MLAIPILKESKMLVTVAVVVSNYFTGTILSASVKYHNWGHTQPYGMFRWTEPSLLKR